MLGQRQPSHNEINQWLEAIRNDSRTSVQWVRYDENYHRWQLGIHNSVTDYVMDIVDNGEMVSYGAILTPDVEGQNQMNFYADCLELNGKLNGARIGRENGYLILIRDDFKGGLTLMPFARSIAWLDQVHQWLLHELYKSAIKHNVRFKTIR